MSSFVTHLEAAIDGAVLPARTLQTIHPAGPTGRPLWVRYDLPRVKEAMRKESLAKRPTTMWRYRELLPVERDENIVSLGEGMSALLDCPRLAKKLGVARLIIKDESQLPTGSFKSRGLAMAVSMAKELGVKRVAIPTAGNAGGALAAYAARAGLECYVFMPQDTPVVNRLEIPLFGARAFLVNGLITDCAKIVREGAQRMGWFDFSTLKEPYRIEGKKTMGLELAEQMSWSLPDSILYPTGGGTGLIGMWKAFAELEAIGWLPGSSSGGKGKKPRMFSCQSSGCAPLPTAFDKGERFAELFPDAHTIASGLRVPRALGDFMVLDAVKESGGRAVAADESKLLGWMRIAMEAEGVSLCPESAACIGVLLEGLSKGWFKREETIVLFNTGAAQKYVEAMEQAVGGLPKLDHNAIDWKRIEG